MLLSLYLTSLVVIKLMEQGENLELTSPVALCSVQGSQSGALNTSLMCPQGLNAQTTLPARPLST